MSESRDAGIADYVLGLMEPEEAERFERQLDRDPGLADEVRAGQRQMHALDLTARPLIAGEALWSRIEAEIAVPAAEATPVPLGGSPQVASRPSPWSAIWNSLGFWRPVGLAGAAASFALAIGLAAGAFDASATPQFVAILVSQDGSAAGAIVQVDDAGEARLIPLRDIPVPEGRALEVWTLPSPERGPVSVGLIDRARSTDLSLGALPPTHGEQLFEITLEPATGSPIGRPTGPILFKGLTTRAL